MLKFIIFLNPSPQTQIYITKVSIDQLSKMCNNIFCRETISIILIIIERNGRYEKRKSRG